MLTCIARSKHPGDDSLNQPDGIDPNATPSTKQPLKSLTYQIKDMALKASGAYRNCNSCTGPTTQHRQKSYRGGGGESNSAAERFRWSHRRTASSNSVGSRQWGKEMEERLKGMSSGEGTPASASGRRVDPVVFVEEHEPKEWVAQVDSGVLITFVSMPRGGNDLKRIRFSREKYNKWQAQKWWTENYDRVMELYNVQRLNRQAFPLPPTPPRSPLPPTPPRSEAESVKTGPAEETPSTPPLTKEHHPVQRYNYDSGLTSTPEISSISGAKTETSSVDASIRTSSSREADRSGEISVSNGSDQETEWVEEDEPGVYITIRALPGRKRELRRVRFSREKFGEMHARLWWEENRARVHKQYL